MRVLRNARRFRMASILWLLVLAASGTPGRLVAEEDGCPKDNRDCTLTEEIMDCLLTSNEADEECMEDAAKADSWFWGAINAIGCEAANVVNSGTCPLQGPVQWMLKI